MSGQQLPKDNYLVDSFHINVGAGDGAIHIVSSQPVGARKRKVEKAIMLDAGRNNTLVSRNINRTVSEIERNYNCPGRGNTLQFDNFVVSHWDGDHYEGVFEFLLADIRAQIEASNRSPTQVYSKLTRAKYINNLPISCFVSPTIVPAFRRGRNGADTGPGRRFFYKTKYNNVDYLGIYWKYYDSNRHSRDVFIDRALILRQGANSLLGVNLFDRNSRPLYEGRSAIKSIEHLVGRRAIAEPGTPDAQRPGHDVFPGMYIVAMDKYIFGWRNQVMTLTDRNRRSICTMIIWAEPVAQPPLNNHVSHFSGGDIGYDMEEVLAAWARTHSNPMVPDFTVTTLKLSHHGSRESSLLPYLYLMRPRNIWNSAGDLYRHPRWEVLTFIHGLKVLEGWNDLRLFPSQYPYYLILDRNWYFEINESFNANGLRANSEFRHEFNARWGQVQGHLARSGFFSRYDSWREANPHNGWIQRQVKLLGLMRTLMEDITPHYYQLVRYENAHNKNSQVAYVCFRSSPRGLPNQFADGSVTSCYDWLDRTDNNYPKFTAHGPPVFASAADQTWRESIKTVLDDHMGIDVGGVQDLTRVRRQDAGPDAQSPLGIGEELFMDIGDISKIGESSNDQIWDLDAASSRRSSQNEWDVLARDDGSMTDSNLGNDGQASLLGLTKLDQSVGYLTLDAAIAEFPSPPVLLPKGHLLAGFVDALRYRHITFSVPKDHSKLPGVVRITLADEDNWLQWFRLVLTMGQTAADNKGLAAIFFKPTAWPLLVKETSLDFGVSFSIALRGSREPTHTVRLQFDQSSAPLTMDTLISPGNKDRSNKGASADSTKALSDLLEKRITITFGLNIKALGEQNAGLAKNPDGLKTTLGAVAELFSFQTDTTPAFKFLEAIELTMDTGPDSRHALWFRPGDEYNTILRMQFKADVTALNSWMGQWLKGLTIDQILVVARKQAKHGYKNKTEGALVESELIFLLQARISGFSFDASVIVGQNRAAFHLSTPSSFQTTTTANSILTAILKWLTSDLGVGDKNDKGERSMSLDTWLGEDGAEVIDRGSVIPRGVDIELMLDSEGGIIEVGQVSVVLEAAVKIGKAMGDGDSGARGPVLFMLVFGWTQTEGVFLRGDLWCKTPKIQFDNYAKALPGYERFFTWEPVTPLDPETQQLGLDIRTLIASKTGETIANIPSCIPTLIVKAGIELSQKQGVSFAGELRCVPRSDKDLKSDTKPPIVFLDIVTFSAAYSWNASDRGLEVNLGVDVVLRKYGADIDSDDRSLDDIGDEARFMARIGYNKGGWKLEGGVEKLKVGHIAQFWNPHTRDEIMQYMGKLAIDYATVEYLFNDPEASDPKQSSLTFEGQLSLGTVLKLKLEYVNKGSDDWFFEAKLSPKAGESGTCTIQDVLESILDSEFEGIPPAIMKTTIPTMGSGKEALRLFCAKEQDMTVFALMVNIGSISLWFLQLRRKGHRVKRIVKAAISDISVKVDLFGQTIKSPFEQFFFLWAQDSQPPVPPSTLKDGDEETKEQTVRGITYREYELLSACLQEKGGVRPDDLFLYKQNKESYAEMDTIIVAGCHLVAVGQGTTGKQGVVLDYVFGRPSQPGPKLLLSEADRRLSYDDCDRSLWQMAVPDDEGNGVDEKPEKGAKAPLRVSRGPLSIENVSLYFKDGRIGVTLDATFLLGPVGLALLGFTINVPFDKDHTLSNPPTINDINFKLAGVAVSLDQPPLTLAGAFMYDDSDPYIKKYSGGLIFAFAPWQFEAMGVYATVSKEFFGKTSQSIFDSPHKSKPQDDRTYTMLFIYCRLNGPLFSIGVVDVAGLIGGFGMNCDISLPTVEQVVDFPFIKNRTTPKGKKDSPIDTLKSLMSGSWFRPAEGLYWAAAGVRCTAFQMLSVDAVLVVQFGGDNLKLGIYGIATLDAPSLLAPVKFAHIELGIVVALDIQAGVFKLEAQLSPRSFVLAEACHLTGGIAFYSWFKADTHKNIAAGDWVLSLGGYHQAFRAPAHYPQPPRLGINWSLDQSLSITGEAYFAITPKVCMGGGRLHAVLSLGKLYAYFDAFLDFLINMEPFFFQLQSKIAIGVRFTMDLWIVTIRISAEVSASLQVSGPPFGGVVHVDFWVFGFDVKFGASPSRPEKISIDKFWEMVLKTASTAGASSLLLAGPSQGKWKGEKQSPKLPPSCLLTCESGLEPKPGKGKETTDDDKNRDEKWLVRGGVFSFQATFQFAVNKGSLRETLLEDCRCQPMEFFTDGSVRTDIYAKPMHLRSVLTSNVTILVSQTAPPTFQRHHGQQAVRAMGSWKDQKWRIKPILKPASVSIWGQYDETSDPSDPRSKGNNVSSLLDDKDSTIPLVMGLSIAPPEPEMSDDQIKYFNVVEDGKQYVFSGQPTPNFPGVKVKSDTAWEPRAPSCKESWKEVPDIWRGLIKREKPVFDPTGVASMWAAKMGFQDGQVSGARPLKLLERFENMVPTLPMVAVGR